MSSSIERRAPPWVLGAMLALGCSSPAAGTPIVDAGSDAAEDARPIPTCPRAPRVTAFPKSCQGKESLCARTFDDVTVAMTHNAMSNSDDAWAAPNQHHGIARQLDDGVRGLMLDAHYYDEDTGATDAKIESVPVLAQTYLCHGICRFGKRHLIDGLCDVTRFLDAHRGEIISIIFETYLKDADLVAAITASGLSEYAYTHPAGAAWPTLRKLVDDDRRAILFVEDGGGTPAWLAPAWKSVQDTPYTFSKASEFTCKLNRGARSNPLFLINHWIGDPLANPDRAVEVNATDLLLGRARQCEKEAGHRVNFLGIDFYDLGAVLGVVETLNGG